MNNTIHITSESKKLIIKNVTELVSSDYKKYRYTDESSIDFDIKMVKKYNKIPLLLVIYLPKDLLHIIMTYINDIFIVKCSMSKLVSHLYIFHIYTEEIVIDYNSFCFDYEIVFDTTDILHNVHRQINYNNTDDPYCIEHNHCLHPTSLNRKLIRLDYGTHNHNDIHIFNKYMSKYYNIHNYINIPCNGIPVFSEIYKYKKMKNMIVIVKLLLYTLLGK